MAKSKFSADHALKSQTRMYSQSAEGITLNMKTVGADGKETTTKTTYHLDGKDYPVTGSPEYDRLSAKQINTNTAAFTLKKAGKAVATTRRTVSKDGKTLTASAPSRSPTDRAWSASNSHRSDDRVRKPANSACRVST